MNERPFCARIDPTAGGTGLIAIREALRAWLRDVGLVEPDLHQVLIAAGEACSNVVEHSGAEHERAGVAAWIRASCARGRVRVVITDRGTWKDPVHTCGPSSGSTDRPGGRGRGRVMMAGLVDHVEISTGPHGTTVELTKELR